MYKQGRQFSDINNKKQTQNRKMVDKKIANNLKGGIPGRITRYLNKKIELCTCTQIHTPIIVYRIRFTPRFMQFHVKTFLPNSTCNSIILHISCLYLSPNQNALICQEKNNTCQAEETDEILKFQLWQRS